MFKEIVAIKVRAGYNYKEAILTGVKFGATVAGLGVAYLYGPAGLFWGTYYGASYLLKGIGIAGITGAAAATKAGLIVAESSAAKTALVATGGLISNYGAEAAMKGGELALTSFQYAAKGAWSLGTSVYNKFWGSKPVVEEVKPMSREDMRANILRAVEKRTTKTA